MDVILEGESSGADREERFAAERGIPVFHSFNDLESWARGIQ